MRIYDNPAYSIKLIMRNGEEVIYNLDQIQTNDHQTKSGIIDEFVDSLVNGRDPSISGASVLPAMRAVFAGIESSESGRSVYIKENE
jgi:predicted dehydrogenase